MAQEMPDIDETLKATYANLRGAFEGGDFASETPVAEVEEEEIPAEASETPQEGVEEPESAEGQGEEPQAAGEAEGEQETPQNFQPKWKKAALAEWEKLPPAVRAEVERRENDFHKGIEQYKDRATVAQEWERTCQPFMATISSFGVTPQVAAQELFKADHLLRYSPTPQKVQMLMKIAGDYGVDLQTLANGIQQIAGEQVWQQQNPMDPRTQQLQTRVNQLEQQLNTTQQQRVAQETSSIDGEIAAFAADPDHEHFGILQKDMAVLLQNGMAKDLDGAYEMAMRQNPQTYQIWLAQQQQEWDAQRKAKVAKAKQAGANNVRPNGRTSQPAAAPKRTMEEDIEATARELGLLN
jgi:hypothetical protein